MFTNLPYIYEGQILEVTESPGKPGFVTYRCMVELPNGQQIILPFVQASSMFGGVADYMQIRSRTAKDSGEEFKYSDNDERNNTSIGDRVYIAFVSGNIQKPIIIGYAQHPNQTQEFTDPTSLDPQAVFQYNGVRIKVDDKGQVTIARQGSPTIKSEPAGGGLLGAAAGALGSLGGGNPALPPDSPAVEMPEDTELTILEMLEEGIFRIRDADGQMIEIDRTKNRIYISNNDLKSTEDPAVGPASGGNAFATNSTDAEYVLLDKEKEMVLINARKIAQIYSFDRRKDVTDGDHSHKIGGNTDTTVGGNLTEKVLGAWTVESAGDVKLTGGKATIKLGKGKIGMGSPVGELIDLIIQTLEEFGNLLKADQAQTHLGNLGYPSSPPINLANYAAVQLKIELIKKIFGQLKGGI